METSIQFARLVLCLDGGTSVLRADLMDPQTGQVLEHSQQLNPLHHIEFDMLSRIQAIEAGSSLQVDQAQAFFSGVRKMLDALCRKAGWPLDHVDLVLLAANSPLTHLVMGQSISHLGVIPDKFLRCPSYSLSFSELPALAALNEGEVVSLPQSSTFIGADNLAALQLLSWDSEPFPQLFIDLGASIECLVRTDYGTWASSCESRPLLQGLDLPAGFSSFSDLADQVSIWKKEGRLTRQGKVDARPDLDLQDLRYVKGALTTMLDIVLAEAGITLQEIRRLHLVGLPDSDVQALFDLGILPPTFAGRKKNYGQEAVVKGLVEVVRQGSLPRWMDLQYIELSTYPNFYRRLYKNMQL